MNIPFGVLVMAKMQKRPKMTKIRPGGQKTQLLFDFLFCDGRVFWHLSTSALASTNMSDVRPCSFHFPTFLFYFFPICFLFPLFSDLSFLIFIFFSSQFWKKNACSLYFIFGEVCKKKGPGGANPSSQYDDF